MRVGRLSEYGRKDTVLPPVEAATTTRIALAWDDFETMLSPKEGQG